MPQLLGKEVGPIGYGLMGLTWRPNPCSEEQAFKAMRAALEQGCNFWNGGEFYGTPEYNSLHLLERYFTKYPEDADKVVLSIKGGLKNMVPDGTPEGVRRSMDNCLKLLNGKKKLDIFECARVDKNVPIEVTLKELEKYVQEGKLGGISLSEVSGPTIRKAASITKIVAVEVELSLFHTDVLTNGTAAACAEHNIPLIAYSPLGRGFLTGQIKSLNDIPEGDFRHHFPRFQPGNFETNMTLVHDVEKIAKAKGCTTGQVAVAWVLSHSQKGNNPVIIPIPGATTDSRVTENAKVVTLSEEDLKKLESTLAKFTPAGDRYPEMAKPHLDA